VRSEPVGLGPGAVARAVASAVAVLAILAVVSVVGAACGGEASSSAERQRDVARRGAEVMPFDLEATTHRFEPVDDGLVETVVADDPDGPGGAEQVELVRRHLAHEAELFDRGDYADPAAIHGDDMPGLAQLRAGAAEIRVVYEPTSAGGRIRYTTTNPALILALHRWAEAQTADHATHAAG
jgi:hypothetical protein